MISEKCPTMQQINNLVKLYLGLNRHWCHCTKLNLPTEPKITTKYMHLFQFLKKSATIVQCDISKQECEKFRRNHKYNKKKWLYAFINQVALFVIKTVLLVLLAHGIGPDELTHETYLICLKYS